ncbi:MAG: hypothetical protein QG549_402 [Patescibacteria group bacterium]|nr:hypothetical protein [Patescibacteria group bacterium]
MNSFDTVTSFAIILLAAAIHASFQLSVSVLTLLSGHALGRKSARSRLLKLVYGFIAGAAVITVLLLSTFAFVLLSASADALLTLWTLVCGAAIAVGIAVWLFYYRERRGTTLWIPRSFADFLASRSKHSKNTAEAFGLGMTSVFAEIVFVFVPLVITALVLTELPYDLQLVGILAYSLVSIAPLLFVGLRIANGHKLSHIQKWRETNKHFLQFAAGSGLLVLGMYVYVERVMNVVLVQLGGA